jgi:hypothetical protein
MVAGLAFLATAIATLFAQTMLVRFSRNKAPHQRAWAIALAMFAAASTAFALGASTGWDTGVFRVFYLFGAILNVPWLALGTVYLLWGSAVGRRVQAGLVFLSGLSLGAVLAAPMHGTLPVDHIPVGREHFDALPRILAAVGSGVGAVVLIGGALVSVARYLRRRDGAASARLAGANALIALGTLVLSSGGLIQGLIGDTPTARDEAFAISLAAGISIVFAGFSLATRSAPAARPAAVAAA